MIPKQIKIYHGNPVDTVVLITALPSPFPGRGYLTPYFSVPRGEAEQYCRRYFPGVKIVIEPSQKNLFQLTEGKES